MLLFTPIYRFKGCVSLQAAGVGAGAGSEARRGGAEGKLARARPSASVPRRRSLCLMYRPPLASPARADARPPAQAPAQPQAQRAKGVVRRASSTQEILVHRQFSKLQMSSAVEHAATASAADVYASLVKDLLYPCDVSHQVFMDTSHVVIVVVVVVVVMKRFIRLKHKGYKNYVLNMASVKCCKTQQCKNCICIQCGTCYHKNHIDRIQDRIDIDEMRIICCQPDDDVTEPKDLLKETKNNNALLQEKVDKMASSTSSVPQKMTYADVTSTTVKHYTKKVPPIIVKSKTKCDKVLRVLLTCGLQQNSKNTKMLNSIELTSMRILVKVDPSYQAMISVTDYPNMTPFQWLADGTITCISLYANATESS
ncbi:Protein of unknown function [Gryllus bimaculatus]|nr:Protein of unknown function [Gryllus bimaculatus]